MPVLPVETLDDERLAPYRMIRDREVAQQGDLFIAEGEHVVRRLLASDFPVHSLFLAQRRVEEIAPHAHPDVPIYAGPDELVNATLGYKFHSGVMACGRRKTELTIEHIVSNWDSEPARPRTLLICPQVINHDNLGSLIRIGAAFGVDAMLVGPTSCDPFWRRSIRVSMGTIFSLPLARSMDLLRDMRELRERWGVEQVATVLAPDAQPLAQARRALRMGLVVGNEAQGLSRQEVAACQRQVTIPMQLGTDSLNIAMATAIMLYHFTQASMFATGGSR